MTDRLTPDQRRRAMQAVKAKDSQIELLLRRGLWAQGYRYRLHDKNLPGKPDIVFVSERVVIFCDSEFWHGYDWELRKLEIKTNQEFWHKKIQRNIERDHEVTEQLRNQDWIVLRFWGHDIKQDLDGCIKVIVQTLANKRKEKLSSDPILTRKVNNAVRSSS